MITAEFEMIDKKKADAYLALSLGNPRWKSEKKVIDERKVQKLINDIVAGKWNTAGDSIKFDENGYFRDGHHRLTAISRCGIPCLVLVVRNVPEEALLHIDDNSARPLYQRTEYSKTQLAMPGIFEILLTGNVGSKDKISDNQKLEWLEKHPLSEEAYQIVSKQYQRKMIMRTAGCAVGIMCAYEYGISRKDLERFVNAVISGEQKNENEHCVIVLRDQLSERRSNSAKRTAAEANYTQSALYDYLNGIPRRNSYSDKLGFYFSEMKKRNDPLYLRD